MNSAQCCECSYQWEPQKLELCECPDGVSATLDRPSAIYCQYCYLQCPICFSVLVDASWPDMLVQNGTY